MSQVFEFALTEADGIDAWSAIQWPKGFRVVLDEERRESRSYLDTFDWRLFKAGRTLCRVGSMLIWGDLDGEAESSLRARTGKSFFCWDLPKGELHDTLEQLIEMRALYARLPLEVTVSRYNLLDDLDKTVARLSLARYGEAGEGGCRVEAMPILGYEKIFEKVGAKLESAGFKVSPQPLMARLLDEHQLDPNAYQSKPKITLTPEMAGGRAAREVLAHLLKVMDANMDGMVADLDSEFLHDYRVAIRRIRSAAAWIGFCVDEATLARLKQDFSALGAATGATRDIDVYLLKEDDYRRKLPPEDRESITPFFQWLEKRRVSERRKMLNVIQSAKTTANIAHWEAFCKAPVVGGQPILPLAKRMITKRYKKILKAGGRIKDESPDEMLHDLRIDCKKLRYLLETFNSLFPADEMKSLIKSLKGLQEVLGDFNDLYVQQCKLKDYTNHVDPKDGRETLTGCGFLVACLYHQQREVRLHFAERFDAFSDASVRERFQVLFGETEVSE